MTQVSAGDRHSCALAGGQAFCWGANNLGQLGTGNPGADEAAPVAVSGLSGKTVTRISAGTDTTCAIADSDLYCWGSDAHQKLGNGASGASASPTLVTADGSTMTGAAFNAAPVTHVSVGAQTVCAVVTIAGAGRAYCWGSNDDLQLGTTSVLPGSEADRPVQVAYGLAAVLYGKTVTDIAVGISYDTHVCVVASGDVYCWGFAIDGALGAGPQASNQATPKLVPGTTGATAVTAGSGHTCAIISGAAWCWGFNGSGQLGYTDGTASTDVPTAVSTSGALSGTVVAISAGYYHTCALTPGRRSHPGGLLGEQRKRSAGDRVRDAVPLGHAAQRRVRRVAGRGPARHLRCHESHSRRPFFVTWCADRARGCSRDRIGHRHLERPDRHRGGSDHRVPGRGACGSAGREHLLHRSGRTVVLAHRTGRWCRAYRVGPGSQPGRPRRGPGRRGGVHACRPAAAAVAPPPPVAPPAPTADVTAPTLRWTRVGPSVALSSVTASWAGSDDTGVASYRGPHPRSDDGRPSRGVGTRDDAARHDHDSDVQVRGGRHHVPSGDCCRRGRECGLSGRLLRRVRRRRPLSCPPSHGRGPWSRPGGYTFGRALSTRQRLATLTLPRATGSRLALIVRKGPGAGTVGVYVKGRKVATVPLGARRTALRQLVVLKVRTAGLPVVLRVDKPGAGVVVDGIAVLK